MKKPKSIRHQLTGPIRAAGIREVSRSTGISASTISQWLSQAERPGRSTARLNSDQIERIVRALQMEISISHRDAATVTRIRKRKPGAKR